MPWKFNGSCLGLVEFEVPAFAVAFVYQLVGFIVVRETEARSIPCERFTGVVEADISELDGLSERTGVFEVRTGVVVGLVPDGGFAPFGVVADRFFVNACGATTASFILELGCEGAVGGLGDDAGGIAVVAGDE